MGKIYVIRHATTQANLSGDLVKHYDSYDILPFNVEEWFLKVGHNLPEKFSIFCSPAKRCQQTAKALFGDKEIITTDCLKEFECYLSGRKFWEITEEEFDKVTMMKKENINRRLEISLGLLPRNEDIVLVTHGFYTRALYSYLNKDGDTPYTIMNSKNFKFSNLDMMVINEFRNVENVYRFKDPIIRGQ